MLKITSPQPSPSKGEGKHAKSLPASLYGKGGVICPPYAKGDLGGLIKTSLTLLLKEGISPLWIKRG